ncbi:MAG TPA: bifunctional 2-polyprenyl-6-hydroxyphenol methylase/3-demethylubiquinol 3-O-methyltransferase UbiG [Chloroflexia bacterium]|nr:bifunctional 2-polyprenyl-6-hydroxyphenol methylase/3-demethylubiquinol 3-O-methyltransferase UbiG [Chloroflexia bacterium]
MGRKIDNELYDRFGDDWWNLAGEARLLHEMNPVRFQFFKEALGGSSAIAGRKVLDVGCGGGLLSEEFARQGAHVTGIDLSIPSLEAARRHAEQAGLEIEYQEASAEQLPFADNSFDILICCDFVEHVSDRLDLVLSETARVLKPGGVFLYDTINRTLISRLVAIWILQDILQLVPRHTHVWQMFVKPAELEQALCKAGIIPQKSAGLVPSGLPWEVVYNVLFRQKIGGFRLSTKSKPLSYAGYAVKQGQQRVDNQAYEVNRA